MAVRALPSARRAVWSDAVERRVDELSRVCARAQRARSLPNISHIELPARGISRHATLTEVMMSTSISVAEQREFSKLGRVVQLNGQLREAEHESSVMRCSPTSTHGAVRPLLLGEGRRHFNALAPSRVQSSAQDKELATCWLRKKSNGRRVDPCLAGPAAKHVLPRYVRRCVHHVQKQKT